ncbi:hypothetical protein SAMN04515647_0506 [Cohaesibacter sp. ES.047]|nr:hypothetical protein SAMN04515647_0506 [Cohaesibacter sp. ES.047]
MVYIFAGAMMTASRCEPLEEVDHQGTRSCGSGTNHSIRPVALDHCPLGKNGLAARIAMMLRSKRGSE